MFGRHIENYFLCWLGPIFFNICNSFNAETLEIIYVQGVCYGERLNYHHVAFDPIRSREHRSFYLHDKRKSPYVRSRFSLCVCYLFYLYTCSRKFITPFEHLIRVVTFSRDSVIRNERSTINHCDKITRDILPLDTSLSEMILFQ